MLRNSQANWNHPSVYSMAGVAPYRERIYRMFCSPYPCSKPSDFDDTIPPSVICTGRLVLRTERNTSLSCSKKETLTSRPLSTRSQASIALSIRFESNTTRCPFSIARSVRSFTVKSMSMPFSSAMMYFLLKSVSTSGCPVLTAIMRVGTVHEICATYASASYVFFAYNNS